jgi:hypothetical protein
LLIHQVYPDSWISLGMRLKACRQVNQMSILPGLVVVVISPLEGHFAKCRDYALNLILAAQLSSSSVP